MKRWRTRGLIGVETDDGRTITGTTTCEPEVPLLQRGRDGRRVVGMVEVRIVGNEIQARLPWRHRHANLDLWPRRTEYHDSAGDVLAIRMELVDAEITSLTDLGVPSNPWGLD
jgi:hypothetical protein